MSMRSLITSLVQTLALFGALFFGATTVAADSKPPTIYAFNLSGSGTINRGETVEFNWSVSNNTSEVSISPDIGVVTGTSIEVAPQVTTTYVLTARNANGFVAKSKRITVIVPPEVTAFTATPETVAAGQAVRLDWAAPGATWFYISADAGSDPGQFFNNTTTVRPTRTTTYTVTANNPAGSRTRTVTVPVTAPVPKPAISAFTATPATITAGGATTLSWTTTGAETLSISPGIGAVTGTSLSVQPAVTTTYTLTAANASGSVNRRTTVTVNVPPPAPAPVISSFTASPATITRGSAATLNWAVANTDTVTITASVGASPGTVTGSSVSVAPLEDTLYTITATGAGGSATRTVAVAVRAPAPVIHSFTATPDLIERGGSSALSWSVENGETVSISGLGVVSGNSVTVSPVATTTYTLTVSNGSGSVSANALVTVNVTPPVIQSFAASPAAIAQGESATLTWAVTGANRLTVSPGIGEVTGSSVTVSPMQTTTYELVAANDGGLVSRTVTLTVNTTEPPPVINSFTATPATVVLGSSTTLAWDVTGAATISIAADSGTGPGVVTGNTVAVSPTVNTAYTLTATNSQGVTATRQIIVTVTSPAPVINAFAATPASISAGANSTLAWSVTGATQLTITANVGTSPGNVTGVNLVVTPTETTIYTLTARNAEGVASIQTATVTVTTEPPTGIVIVSLTATPEIVQAGEPVTLTWETINAQSLWMSADRGTDPGDVRGRTSIVVHPTGTTRYTLNAFHSNYPSAYKSVTVVAGPAPVPVINFFRANPPSIAIGRSTTLEWSVENPGETTITASVGANPGVVTGSTLSVSPTEDTTYTIRVRNQFGEATQQVEVDVLPPVPTINSFTATPATIMQGDSTTLGWSVDDATEIALTANVGASPGVVTGNSLSVTPAATTTYTLRARNQHGDVTRTAAVTVIVPSAPVINSFRAAPAFIEAGESTVLSWNVTGADSFAITADTGAAPGPVTGSSVTVAPTVTTTYTLSATNGVGTTTATVPVTIYVPGNGSVAHPRIWITPSRVAQLAQRAAANAPAWLALRDRCDALANMTVLWADEDPRTPGIPADPDGYIWGGYQYIDYLLPATELGLGYQVAKTADPVRAARYAAKAKDIALKLSDPVRHGRESTDSGYSVRVYVPTLALIYDWLYSELHPRERAQIYTEINRWIRWYDAEGFARDFPNGNYFAGYYCGKALGALATEGDNPAAAGMWDDWLNRIHYGMVAPYHAAWLSGGGAPDGWNYGPFEVINMMRPVAAAYTAKGLDLMNGSQPFTWANGHAKWMTQFTWPGLQTVNDRGFLYNSNNPSPASAAWATEYTGLLRLLGGSNTPIAQQYLLDLRARPGTDTAPAWTEFLYFEPDAPVQNYRTELSYRTMGDGQVAMRSSWASDAVFAAFQAGPYTGSHYSGEQFYDQGALTINRGEVGFVVNAWGALLRNTPRLQGNTPGVEGPPDGGIRKSIAGEVPPRGPSPFEELFTEIYGSSNHTEDGTTQPRRLFNTFYAPHAYRDGMFGFFSQVGKYADEAQTTLSRFEDTGRHVMTRGSELEDMYWLPQPILGWERTVVYVRPQVFFVYDRTRMTSGNIDHWMSWSVLNAPILLSSAPEAVVYDVVDSRPRVPAADPIYRGRMTALLPVGRVVNPVDLFERNKVFRMDIRAASPGTDTTWLTVFDAAVSAGAAGTATTLSAATGTVLTGDVEGALVTGADGRGTAVLFSRTGQRVEDILFYIPMRATYCVITDLAPGGSYEVQAVASGDGRMLVGVRPSGSRQASTEGVLAFDVSASQPQP